eukprot:350413-Chlamydomonas_euryale.AAC.5
MEARLNVNGGSPAHVPPQQPRRVSHPPSSLRAAAAKAPGLCPAPARRAPRSGGMRAAAAVAAPAARARPLSSPSASAAHVTPFKAAAGPSPAERREREAAAVAHRRADDEAKRKADDAQRRANARAAKVRAALQACRPHTKQHGTARVRPKAMGCALGPGSAPRLP